jgi:four helix bundle protein
MTRDNVIYKLCKAFALRIIKLYKYLNDEKKEYIISKQIYRSGTSIGANVREAQYAQSPADFVAKLSIALKEGAETQYWIEILQRTELVTVTRMKRLKADCDELVGMLVQSIKASKRKLKKPL